MGAVDEMLVMSAFFACSSFNFTIFEVFEEAKNANGLRREFVPPAGNNKINNKILKRENNIYTHTHIYTNINLYKFNAQKKNVSTSNFPGVCFDHKRKTTIRLILFY